MRAVLAVLALLAVPARGGEAIPSPESVLGFRPGADRRLAGWSQVLDYLARLDAASDRILVEEVGKTTQGRPFVLVTVTSEENHRRLEEIRSTNLRLADPRGLGEEEAAGLVERGKAVVAMAYSIHSTEVGGTLTSLLLLDHLARSDTPEVRRMLEETVLLVLPSHNPDGTDLVADWYRKQLGTPFEGTSPPVLYHPYVGHDNNRDWYMFTQVESRLTVRHLHERWRPQIMHDAHQMRPTGARLFVPPYTDPWEPNVDPAITAAAAALGTHVAARLISEGRAGIVTGAIYDAWTPARAYPHTHGGVRLLSETASARLATPIEVKAEELSGRAGYDAITRSANFPLPWPGGTWRLQDIVETQLRASLAILDHAARHREHWLRTFLGVNRRACARREPFAFVLPASQREPLARARLLEVLRTGGVEIHHARGPFETAGRRYEAGSHVVMMQQPASGFAKSLLERQRYPDLRQHPGGPPRPPYDVTAHTLPLLLGVEVEAVAEPFAADLEPADVPHLEPGGIVGAGPRLALGHGLAELRALARLLAEGVRVCWTLEPLGEGGRNFPAGTLVVDSSARGLLEPLARELGFAAHAVRAEPRGLRLEAAPRVGLYRSWVPSMDEGWTRFVFEKETDVAYRTLQDREIRAGRLRERFDAIVLPEQPAATLLDGHAAGSMPEEYTGGLGVEGVASLRAFVEAGGTLVTLDSASGFALEHLRLPVRDTLAGLESGVFFSPGSLLEVRLEGSHPLSHGLPSRLAVWFESSPAFEATAAAVAARYGEGNPLLSGWLLGADRLAGRAALVDVPLGKGRVVLFGFRPQYRAQSWASYPLLLNALYLSAAVPSGS